MDLLPFFQWCYSTAIGEGIRNSTWLFPVIEAFHLLGLGLTAGAVLVVDFRLLGVGLRKQSAAQLWANTQPWLLGSVTLMFASGIPLFLSESIKCLYSFAFWVKMTSLFLVLLFTFTVLRRRVTQMEVTSDRPQLDRVTALVSLVLWFGVAWGGRWIGFS
jgi:uncharacterized membrane protein SirB2